MKRALAFFAAAALAAAAGPVRVQVTTGGHPYEPAFHAILEGRSDLAVTVNPHPSAYRRDLRKFVDVLVLYDLVEVLGEAEQKNLRDYLEAGHGLVVLHHALASNWQWKWWYEEVVGGRFLMAQEGPLPRSQAKARVVLDCKTVRAHPVVTGIQSLKFEDEGYKGMGHSTRATVLMETDNPDNDQAVVWIGPYQKARVAVIQLGHGAPAYGDAGYRRLVHNAILWAAGRLN